MGGARDKKNNIIDGRSRDKCILAKEGTGCADNRDATFSSANALTALVDCHHTRDAVSVYRHAGALEIEEIRNVIRNHSSSSARKERMKKDLGILGLNLMVIVVESASIYRGITASELFDGHAGCDPTQSALCGR